MNVAHVDRRDPDVSRARRTALYVAFALATAGVGLLVHALISGPRLELLLVSLGLVAGAALIGLLVQAPGGSVVVRNRD
jgi:hypothetical protein